MSWLTPPPVIVVSGAEAHLRRSEIKKALLGAKKKNRRVDYLDGADPSALSSVLAATSPLFKHETLAILTNPEKAPIEVLLKHAAQKSSRVTLVLHVEGEIKKKSPLTKLVDKLDKKFHIQFKSPPTWKREEWCAGILVKTARDLFELSLDAKIAQALVQAAGTNLGVLSFELQKAALLAQHEQSSEIKADHVKQTLSRLVETDAIPIVDALADQHSARLSKAMAVLKKTHGSDPTIKVVALISRNVVQWLHAAGLLKQKATVEEIAQRVGLPPFICKTKTVPIAKRWGDERLASVLTSLARVERAVKSGQVSPWLQLEAALLRAIQQGTTKVK